MEGKNEENSKNKSFLDEIKHLEQFSNEDEITEYEQKIVQASPDEYREFIRHTQKEINEELREGLMDFALARFDNFIFVSMARFDARGKYITKYYKDFEKGKKDYSESEKYLESLERSIIEKAHQDIETQQEDDLYDEYMRSIKDLETDEYINYFMFLQNRISRLMLQSLHEDNKVRVLINLFLDVVKTKKL